MNVKTGHLTEFWLHDPAAAAGAGALVELAELIEVPLPSGAHDLVETSHMKTSGFKSYINAPLREGEEADVTMNYDPGSATDALIRAARAAGTARAYKIVITKATGTWEITGSLIVRDYTRNSPMDDRKTATMRVKWVSTETEAAGA